MERSTVSISGSHVRPWFARLAPVVAAVAIAASGLAFQPSTATASTSDDLKVVGTLPRFPADVVAKLGTRILPPAWSGSNQEIYGGTALSIPEHRQLWQFYPTGAEMSDPAAIAVRDIDSLKIIHTFDLLVGPMRAARGSNAGDWLHATDGKDRLFLLSVPRQGANWAVLEINVRTFTQRLLPVRAAPLGGPAGPPPAVLPGGMEYDAKDDVLFLLFGGLTLSAAGNNATILYRMDLKTGDGSTRLIRSCNGPLAPTDVGTGYQYDGIITADYAYLSCQRVGNIGAVVKIAHSELMSATSTESIVAGPAWLDSSFADPVGGRIFLMTLNSEIWAYDISTSSFVGVLAGNAASVFTSLTGFGLDPVTGRLFIQSPHLGVGIAEGRFYPIPQARTFPHLKANGQERIISDAKTGRLFILTGSSNSKAKEYTIYDAGKAPIPPPAPDPDRNTADIDEQPGVTDARYFAAGSGFGVRALLAKGFLATPPAPAVGAVSPTSEILTRNITSKCGFTDRELMVARVSKAEYDTGSAAAQAIGVDIDERTKLDLANPSRCDVSATNGGTGFQGIFATEPVGAKARENETGIVWDREAASCSSSEGGESAADTSKREGVSKGYVECPLPGGKLVAEAKGYLTGAVAVGQAHVTTNITRDKRGVLSTVVAEAQEIDLAGVIQIGRITAIAESRSNGRPSKDPLSTHTVRVQGVTIDGNTVCTDRCDLNEVIRLLNVAGAGRFEFRSASGRDDALLKGTPKGASTAVQKSTARQASDQALVGDSTTEVVGLEMTSYNDNRIFGRARQIFQFAGVASAATYNITPLPSGAGFDDDAFTGGDIEDDFSVAGSDVDFLLPGVDVLPATSTTDTISSDEPAAGGPIVRALRALARGLRMFFTNPRHALLLFTAWALFSLPPVLSRRRRLLTAARSE